MAELEELIRKRGRIKGKLTRISTYAEQLATNGALEADIKIRLEMLNEIWSDFDGTQMKIECMSRDSELGVQEQEQDDFETKFCVVKARLMRAQESLVMSSRASGSNQVPNEVASNIKLPTIQLPKFAGDYQQWASFSDLFKSVIHQNSSLTPVQKLHYLKSSMQGDAARLLNAIAITDSNYSEAWNILSDRYSNKRQIVQSHLKSLHAQPKLGGESASDIRKLMDVTVENVRALNALGLPTDHWDCMLVFIVTERLDSGTRRHWELSISENENPSFQELKEFLEKRCRALEASGSDKRNAGLPKGNQGHQSHVARRTSVVHHGTTMSCFKCKAQHALYRCEDFIKLPIEERIEFIKVTSLCFNCMRSGHSSKDCNSIPCKKCQKPHHTLLHREREANRETMRVAQGNTVISGHYGSKQTPYLQILLATAIVNIRDHLGKNHQVRTLLDSGSQASFITEACVQQLGLRRRKANIAIGGLGANGVGIARGMVDVQLSSVNANYHCELQALILHKVTGILPSHPIDPVRFKDILHDHEIELADPMYYQPGCIDLLLGADIYYELLLSGKFKHASDTVFQNTKLGWVISGPIKSRPTQAHITSHVGLLDLNHQLKTFWELEEVDRPRNYTAEESECEEQFKATYSRNEEGRFIVQLPFHNSIPELGNTYELAQHRLLQIERRLEGHLSCKKEYHNFMDEYLRLTHMESVGLNDASKIVYHLPHHYVIKESSFTTKLRVVFDGTAKPKSGLSLNESLLVGPTIQEELFNIIMRFRMHNLVFTADITKMYRQILVHPKQCDYQRILWRKSPAEPIQEFRLKTLTYGTATAPFLAIRCLIELANIGEKEYPEGSAVIKSDFYVDDLMSGADTVEEALVIQRQLIDLLAKGGFELCKWTSNDDRLIEQLPEHLRNHSLTQSLDFDTIKTLGIDWQPRPDHFTFRVASQISQVNTKRTVLSQISKLFDPMGWLAPVVLRAKLIIQKLWLLGIEWDQELPDEINTFWRQYQEELHLIEKLTIRRQMTKDSSVKVCQLHGFSDASESAYGAVVFIRSIDINGSAIHLVCSKSKVTPLKRVSLPRLELCGALILARLLKKVSSVLGVGSENLYAWTDSTIVLAWLRKPPHLWKTFIANRTTEIQEILAPEQWRHVKSEDNPADCLSRGLSPRQIIDHNLWWNGPKWLKLAKEHWPSQPKCIKDCKEVLSEKQKNRVLVHAAAASKSEPTLIDRYSSLNKLIRVTAYCNRFSANCKPSSVKRSGCLTTNELFDGLLVWIRYAQSQQFKDELKSCLENRPLSNKSELVSLHPFVDDRGIMRVGGRLQEADIPYRRKHPIILPHHHQLTVLIINQAHIANLHAGLNLLLTVLWRNYWILRARPSVRHLIHKCVVCFRHRLSTSQQLMGNLPQSRVEPARAFLRCGIDYAGPLNVRLARGRGNMKTYKAYICLFVCFTTRAIHIELANDLTTQSFIAALRRFVARRGNPADIFTDCGTNFVGAERELYQLTLSSQHNQQISSTMSSNGTNWHFNPPASPHFGGLWEAGVKSIKYHLRRIVGNVTLTYEELYTVLTQVEACLNSRPLCPIEGDSTELDVLTPGHFLIGEALTAPPDQDVTQLKLTRLSRWDLIQRLYQQFWKRWSTEYLSRLQQRPKWTKVQPNISVGDLIILKEEDRSPLNWPLACILEVHPSKDGLVRTVTVRTKNGNYKRPVIKCCALPFDKIEM